MLNRAEQILKMDTVTSANQRRFSLSKEPCLSAPTGPTSVKPGPPGLQELFPCQHSKSSAHTRMLSVSTRDSWVCEPEHS